MPVGGDGPLGQRASCPLGEPTHWDNGHLARWGKRRVVPFQRAGRPLSQSRAATGGTPVVPVSPSSTGKMPVVPVFNGRDARCPSRAVPSTGGMPRPTNGIGRDPQRLVVLDCAKTPNEIAPTRRTKLCQHAERLTLRAKKWYNSRAMGNYRKRVADTLLSNKLAGNFDSGLDAEKWHDTHVTLGTVLGE